MQRNIAGAIPTPTGSYTMQRTLLHMVAIGRQACVTYWQLRKQIPVPIVDPFFQRPANFAVSIVEVPLSPVTIVPLRPDAAAVLCLETKKPRQTSAEVFFSCSSL